MPFRQPEIDIHLLARQKGEIMGSEYEKDRSDYWMGRAASSLAAAAFSGRVIGETFTRNNLPGYASNFRQYGSSCQWALESIWDILPQKYTMVHNNEQVDFLYSTGSLSVDSYIESSLCWLPPVSGGPTQFSERVNTLLMSALNELAMSLKFALAGGSSARENAVREALRYTIFTYACLAVTNAANNARDRYGSWAVFFPDNLNAEGMRLRNFEYDPDAGFRYRFPFGVWNIMERRTHGERDYNGTYLQTMGEHELSLIRQACEAWSRDCRL